jgi:cytosine/uracil/thiamine/allantoin permease
LVVSFFVALHVQIAFGLLLVQFTGINTTAWTIGSTLLALGLSVGQAMGMVVCAAVIIALLAVGAGWMGSHQHLGFTVVSRRFILCYSWVV